jgi:hypothetical protein
VKSRGKCPKRARPPVLICACLRSKAFSFLVILIGADVFTATAGAQTADIVYSTTELSSDASAGTSTWQYNYTITNTTPGGAALPAIDEFTIYYTLGTYSNMSIVSSPGNWSSLVAQPDPVLAADGFFDAEANNAGLAAGASVANFSVDFTFLGQGTPGSQLFNIVDFNNPATYANPLQVGFTRLATSSVSAPELDASSAASAATLLMGGLLVWRGRRLGCKAADVGRTS